MPKHWKLVEVSLLQNVKEQMKVRSCIYHSEKKNVLGEIENTKGIKNESFLYIA